LLQEANDIFKSADDVHDVLSRTVRLAIERSGGDRGCSVAFAAAADGSKSFAHHNLGASAHARRWPRSSAVLGRELVQGAPVFKSRIAADPRFAGELSGALSGVFSLVVVPLNFPSQAVGLVYVDRLSDNLRGAFKQREINLLAVLANSSAVAMVEAQRSVLLEENQSLKQQLSPKPGLGRIVTQSREMQEILALLGKVGDSTASILLMGETGTGKGLIAQSIHEMSSRRDKRFVAINCAALPDTLLESELFGYVAGRVHRRDQGQGRPLQGSRRRHDLPRRNREDPEPLQAKLLHVLDKGEIRPVGSTRSFQVDARVVAATNAELRERNQGRPLPRGPVLPHERHRDHGAAAARPPRGHPRADRALPRVLRAADGQAGAAARARGHARPAQSRVARQRARTREDGEAHGRAGRARHGGRHRAPARGNARADRDAADRAVGRLQRAATRRAARAPPDPRSARDPSLEQDAGREGARTFVSTLLSKIRLLALDRRRLKI
jgi:hypothetical protein